MGNLVLEEKRINRREKNGKWPWKILSKAKKEKRTKRKKRKKRCRLAFSFNLEKVKIHKEGRGRKLKMAFLSFPPLKKKGIEKGNFWYYT